MRQRTKNYPSKELMVSEGEGGGGERMSKRRGRKIDLTSYQLLLNYVFVLVQCTNSGFSVLKINFIPKLFLS